MYMYIGLISVWQVLDPQWSLIRKKYRNIANDVHYDEFQTMFKGSVKV